MVISGTIPLAHSTFTALLSVPAIIFDYNVTVNGVPFTVNIFVEGPQPPDLLVQPQTLTF